ncbi:MAG: carboxypeptidase regulatory-like domain-containing protein [Myxococcales bacterium]|nr:carboxypeptidase regulatory-like domain-containing protein [Myxococcota bacterium]MDW8283084.1 carboxypeptidase regulatory-like domain-containing protein [Myxococcales bacterium]
MVSRPTSLLLVSLGLLAGSSRLLWAKTEPAGQEVAETRVKTVYKPVPCVPCPCQCPEVRPGGPVAAAPPARGEEPRPAEEPPPPAAEVRPPPPPPRGTLAGQVVVRDRSGREKEDRSDVVVYIERMPKRYAPLKRTRRMAQRDKTFVPRFLAITRGSTVEFPNEDKFFHNVFSLSEGNTFDLGLYRAGTSRSVTFERTGVVDVYCNIHPNMWAQILVLDNPFYAVTGPEGTFEIPKVPPGSYTLVAWVSGGEPVRQQVKVQPGATTQVRFELREGATSKPHLNKFNQPYGRYK